MRKNNKKIDAQIRHDVFSIYSFTCCYRYDAARFAQLSAALPAPEQLATFQALFYDEHDTDFDESKRPGRDACLATLLEAAGQHEEALQIWQALRQKFPRKMEAWGIALAKPSSDCRRVALELNYSINPGTIRASKGLADKLALINL
jgi:hypothetical protein